MRSRSPIPYRVGTNRFCLAEVSCLPNSIRPSIRDVENGEECNNCIARSGGQFVSMAYSLCKERRRNTAENALVETPLLCRSTIGKI